MKRILLLVGALFLLASCTTEFDQLMNGSRSDKARQTTVFQASTEVATAPETKVYADEDMKVLWNADDRISIFNLTTYNYQFAFTGDDGDTAGGFELIPDSGFITGTNVDYVYAAYPYSKTNKLSNQGVFTMVLPAEQSYKEHSFGIGANTMVAVTDGNFLAFKNVGGYLSLRLYGDNVSVSRITIKGNNGEKIAGKGSIDIPFGGTPTVTMDNSATDEISVVCNPAVKIGADANNYTDFWFVIPPVYFSLGFTITVTDDKGGVFERATSKALTINRNTLEWMNPLEVMPNYEQGLSGAENLSESETANCYIVEKEGVYSFIATTIGNGNKGIMAGYHFHTTDASISPVAAKLLWQDHEVVSNITLQNGRVFFNASSEKGNAVIAVTDASGTILWSWHIWATDQPQTYFGPSSTLIMDRNLGAISANKQDGRKTFGLFYQWGRKDPFRGDDYKMTQFDSNTGSVSYTVSHPDEFIAGEPYWTETELTEPWGFSSQTKTIYDPCPSGYKVMNSDSFTYSNTTYDNVYKGRSFGSLWFPFAGRLGYGLAEPVETGWGIVGEMALYFVNSNSSYSCCFDLVFTELSVMTQNLQYKAFGESVRCQKE